MKSTIGQNIPFSKSLQIFWDKCYITNGTSDRDLRDTCEHALSLLYPLKNDKNQSHVN